jgi:hypothetical protein
MRFIFQVTFLAFLSYCIELWLPSWTIVVCAAIISILIRTSATASFFGGFVAISLLWMAKATVIDVYTHSIISTKIIALLGLQRPITLILLTGLVGGLLGGFGSLIGQKLYQILPKNSRYIYRP